MALLDNPQSRGVVQIVSKDPSTAPYIDPKFLSHPYDRRAMVEAFKEMLRWLQAPVWRRKTVRRLGWPDEESDDAILVSHSQPARQPDADVRQAMLRSRLASSWHMCGTVRMGRDAQSACVDSDFRLFGINGLRVADMSVCPFVPKYVLYCLCIRKSPPEQTHSNHTQSTAYVIGAIAAEKIIESHGLDSQRPFARL